MRVLFGRGILRGMRDQLRFAQRLATWLLAALVLPAASLYAGDFPSPLPRNCERGIRADVVAFDQVFFWNRLGAVEPQGMIYALRRDVVPIDSGKGLVPGNVQLREGKRPRPLVLRMNVGDCLSVYFQNLLATSPVDGNQPSTRTASVHVVGMQLVGSIASDGSNVGLNASSLVAPGGSAVYTVYAEREGGYLMYSGAATTGGEGDGGSINAGLFGAVAVQPREAEWYRSQITEADMKYIRDPAAPTEYPIIEYDAVYPPRHPFDGLPVLAMLQNFEIVHSDLTAIITGPNAGRFKDGYVSEGGGGAGSRAAVPRVRDDLSRRDRRGAGLPAFRGPGPRASRCTASAMPSPSTTAPAASGRRSWPTVSASARWATARNASTRSSSSRRGRWPIRPWWSTFRPTRPAR